MQCSVCSQVIFLQHSQISPRTRMTVISFISQIIFISFMLTPHSQEDSFADIADGQYKLINIQNLKNQIRNSRKAIENTLNTLPKNITERHSNGSLTSPYGGRQINDQMSPNRTSNRKDGMARRFELSGRKQIQDVFFGDMENPIASTVKLEEIDIEQERNNQVQIRENNEIFWSRCTSHEEKNNHEVFVNQEGSPQNQKHINGYGYFLKNQKMDEHPLSQSKIHQQYNSTPPPQSHKLDVTNIGQLRESRFAAISSNSPEKQEQEEQVSCKVERDGKRCKLCELTRSHMKRMKNRNSPPPLPTSTPKRQGNIQKWEPEQWVTAVQPRVNKINVSPGRSSKEEYLSSQDKYELRNGSIEPSDKYLQSGSLRRQFFIGLESRRKFIVKQLRKLNNSADNTPQKISQIMNFPVTPNSKRQKIPRKKIFDSAQTPKCNPSPSSIKKTEQEASRFTYNDFFSSKSKDKSRQRTYGELYASKIDKNYLSSLYPQKTITREVKFDHIRANLTNNRIKVYRSKSKQCQSPQKSMIPGLRLFEMPVEVRRWYQAHRKKIVYECERICVNDLIVRYMSQQEVSARLYKFVVGMVDPKKWLMLMIDQVYSKLKDRYMTVPS